MNEKDAATIKALAELGLRKEEPLTPEQEQLLKRALDPHEEFLAQVEKLFCEQDDFDRQRSDVQTMFRVQRFWSQRFEEYLRAIFGSNHTVTVGSDFDKQPRFDVGGRIWWLERPQIKALTDAQRDKLMTTYDRMARAKKAYEDAGGTYEVSFNQQPLRDSSLDESDHNEFEAIRKVTKKAKLKQYKLAKARNKALTDQTRQLIAGIQYEYGDENQTSENRGLTSILSVFGDLRWMTFKLDPTRGLGKQLKELSDKRIRYFKQSVNLANELSPPQHK